ncbi:unnamed protein product [Alternaria alternata]
MDPMSITGTVLAIVHITGICLKSGNQHLGPSRYTSTTLLSLIQELYCFYGAIQSLKTHLTINEHDTIRLNSLDCLTGPLSDCKLALCLVEKQLKDDTFFKRKLIGKHCDKKLDDAINVLKKGRGLFETILLADQRTITTAIERYTINIAEDIRDIKNKLEGDGELMRGLTRQLTLRLETANEREEEMRSTLREIDSKLLRERESRRGGTPEAEMVEVDCYRQPIGFPDCDSASVHQPAREKW